MRRPNAFRCEQNMTKIPWSLVGRTVIFIIPHRIWIHLIPFSSLYFFGSSIVPHVMLLIMATDPVNDHSWVAPLAPSTSSSTTLVKPHIEDINSTW